MAKLNSWIDRNERWVFALAYVIMTSCTALPAYSFLRVRWWDTPEKIDRALIYGEIVTGGLLIGMAAFGCFTGFRSAMRTKRASLSGFSFFLFGSFLLLWQILIGFAHIYFAVGLKGSAEDGLQDTAGLVHDPYTSLYFSAMTFTTVGYGDLTPTKTARLWASLEAICGFIYIGVFIAVLTSMIGATIAPSKRSDNAT